MARKTAARPASSRKAGRRSRKEAASGPGPKPGKKASRKSGTTTGTKPEKATRTTQSRRPPGSPGRSPSPDARREQPLDRLLALAAELPEVEVTGSQHRSFAVRKKKFAYYLDDHHGDGIVSLCAKATLDEQAMYVANDPDSYYVPAYVGAKGWVAIRLDRARVDWGRVTELLRNAYRAQAPRRLAEQIE